MFSFAIARVSSYTAIANYVSVLNAFGVRVVYIQLAISFLLGGVMARYYG